MAPISNILSHDGTEGLIWAFEKVPGPVGDGVPFPTSEAEMHFVQSVVNTWLLYPVFCIKVQQLKGINVSSPPGQQGL